MRFNFKIAVKGDVNEMMLREIVAAERAVSRGIRKGGDGLKRDWRAQVKAAGLGNRLANTVRAANYPQAIESIGAASLVYSRAPVVLDAQDRGALIRSKSGLWLAIPVGEVQRMRGRRGIGGPQQYRITPGGWEQRTGRRLHFVYRKGKPALLVDTGTKLTRQFTDSLKWQASPQKRKARSWKVIFILVPQAKLRRKMDLDAASRLWGDRLPGLILDNWKG